MTDWEKRLPSQWATEECMNRMHQQLTSTWSLHFPFTPGQVNPPDPHRHSDLIVVFVFFLFVFLLHPLPWCRGPRCPQPHLAFPFNQVMRVGVGVKLLLKDFKPHSNMKTFTSDEAMQLVPSLKWLTLNFQYDMKDYCLFPLWTLSRKMAQFSGLKLNFRRPLLVIYFVSIRKNWWNVRSHRQMVTELPKKIKCLCSERVDLFPLLKLSSFFHSTWAAWTPTRFWNVKKCGSFSPFLICDVIDT